MASSHCDASVIATPCPEWDSLVLRSIKAWETLAQMGSSMQEECLRTFTSLDDFLCSAPETVMFWFFQRREAFLSQKKMSKWSRERLEDYVLLPASYGFVSKAECFFVSHFWQSKDDPDPDSIYLRLQQETLRSQTWSYIWVDWTCIPQDPRTQVEEVYFRRSLQTMSGIIRNCAFTWHYPPFEPRMWILYEIAESALTSTGGFHATSDIMVFLNHVNEMLQVGVRATLDKYGYKCTYDRDKQYLTSWLEILVLSRQRLELLDARCLLDAFTWHPNLKRFVMFTGYGVVEALWHEGILVVGGERYTFTPFPRWEDGKYSANTALASV